VEILVVISILIILVGLIATTARLGLNYANASATRVLIDTLDSAVEEKMKTYYTTNLASPSVDNYLILAGLDPTTMAADPNSPIGQRAAVIARLDSVRSAFPQLFAEIVPNASLVNALRATTHPTFEPALSTGLSQLTANSVAGSATAPLIAPDPTMQDIMIEFLIATKQIATKADFTQRGGYNNVPTAIPGTATQWSTIPGRLADGSTNPLNNATHNPETESSECLYLILQKDPALEGVSAKFIKDTDGDGLLEFVDSYGKPIKWYRHAPDLFAYWIEVTQQYRSAATSKLDLVLDGDQVFEPVGDNTFDSQNLLYDYQTTNDWWAASSSESFGPITAASHKDVFEALVGRLHRAYNRPSPPDYSAPIGSSPAELAIAADPVTGRNNGQNVPRPYPFRSVIVSAGSDGEFGLYSTTTDIDGNGTPDATHPALHMGIKGGRVEEDPDRRSKVRDNIVSVELQDGIQQ
jgi:type II secretory pathway pseudopilin PulG